MGRIQEKDVGGWLQWKYYVLMYENGKMRLVETVAGIEDKGEWWRGWIQLWYIVRTFVMSSVTTVQQK
jgi:hypothetical protein